jgi:hypothetical protein
MTRSQLEHLIRAAAVIADDDELIIIGSQAILGHLLPLPSARIDLIAMLIEADVQHLPRGN